MLPSILFSRYPLCILTNGTFLSNRGERLLDTVDRESPEGVLSHSIGTRSSQERINRSFKNGKNKQVFLDGFSIGIFSRKGYFFPRNAFRGR